MKIIKDGVTYEGTPEELRQFFPDIDLRLAVAGSEEATLPKDELIRRVLNRVPLAENHALLLRTLYQSGDAPVTYADLAAAMDRTTGQLNGILGKLGSRINDTAGVEGRPGIEFFLDVTRSDDYYTYRLLPEVRDVLEEGDYDWLKG